ncbi:MAG TPA: hypothetical protein VFS60_15690 [Thermoanaerobaculia bacterium]|nr:hypothetical protein [Thermoanaerobaculia bacterium]
MTARLTKPFDAPLEMRWRARVDAANLEFRVYGGPDAEHLRLRATLSANRGEDSYRYRDEASGADALYEVRAAAADGSEQLLARAFCTRTSDVRGGLAAGGAAPLGGVLVDCRWAEPPGQPREEPDLAIVDSRPRARPMVPPPRSSRA